MRKFLFAAAGFIFFLAVFSLLPEAEAAPAFARQTGLACNTCHFQHFPTLNAFGRAFKAGGYTLVGGQSMVEGDFLSIPATLNASLVTKIRYQKTNGDDEAEPTNKGELQFPDEAALLIGGRAGEHVGFLAEVQLADNATPALASYKMPIVYTVSDTNINVIPFSTDALGASYGFELLNTGAVHHQRPLEHASDMSAQQYIGTDTAATGVAFVAAHSLYHVNYTMWAPVHGTNNAGPYLSYIRAAVTPTLAGWDAGAGAQVWKGTTKYDDGTGTMVRQSADAWSLDAQMQGPVANMPLGVYLSYGTARKSAAGETANLLNAGSNDRSAWALTGELGVMPGRLTLSAGYRAGKQGNVANDDDNAFLIGASYLVTQNVQLQLNHSLYSGSAFDTPQATGDSLTTLMVFAAF